MRVACEKRKQVVRVLGIAEEARNVVVERDDLRITNYDLGGGEAVAAIGDRGVAAATLECGSEAAALSKGAQLPYDAKSTRNRAGSATVAAIGDRGNVATAVPSHGNHGSAVASGERGSGLRAAIAAAENLKQRRKGAKPAASSNSLPGNEFTSGGMHFCVANHRGDTVLAVSESGVAEAHIQYDAFGNVVAKSGSFEPSYTFSTKEYLPSANVYLYAYRVYDPQAGRWTQRDPIDYQDSVNLYQFCGNNAANVTDPDGRFLFGRMAALTGHTQMSGADKDYYLAMTEATRNVQVTAVGTFYVGVATPLVYSAGAAGVVAAKNAVVLYMFAGPGVIRVFYSGYPTAWEHAQRYCQAVGNAVTLNMTRTGRLLTAGQDFLHPTIMKLLWQQASAWYASGASGTTPVFLSGSRFSVDSIFYTVEYPVLKTIETVQMQFVVVP